MKTKFVRMFQTVVFMVGLFIWSGVVQALEIRLTMYADGKSCPANCDAHVVFDNPSTGTKLNGTEFAHTPSSTDTSYKKCTQNTECEICIASGRKQCFTVMYRGAGPSKNTFDFTPAFFEARCQNTEGLPSLKKKCDELIRDAAALKNRINCIRTSEHVACKDLMTRAKAQQETDLVSYQQCKSLGAAQFNNTKPVAQRRSSDCAYEAKGTGGPNSKGVTWKKLLPGACYVGSYVGRDGLDCCSGNVMADGHLGRECRAFYPAY